MNLSLSLLALASLFAGFPQAAPLPPHRGSATTATAGIAAARLSAFTAANSFAGAYKGKTDDGEATLNLTQDAEGNVTGTLKMDGETLTLTGKAEGDKATGTATVPGVPVPLGFELRRTASGGLTFALVFDGTRDPDSEITFTGTTKPASPAAVPTRSAPGAASAKPPAPVKPAVPAANVAPAARAGMKTYRHPAGLSLQYPAAWTVTEAGGLLAMVPPGVQKDAGGKALEAFLARAEAARGISAADDPRVLEAVDGLLAKSAPYLRRLGGAKPMPPAAGGAASRVVLVYEGNAPDGKTFQVRVYLAVLGDVYVTVMAQAPKAKMAGRQKDVEAIFASIRVGEAAIDPVLVGTWTGQLNDNGRLIDNNATGQRTQVASDSQTRYTLSADGTIVQTTRRRTIVNQPGISLDTGDYEEKTTGRWNAGGGKLYIAWEKGESATLTYRVEGDRIVLNNGAGVFRRAQ